MVHGASTERIVGPLAEEILTEVDRLCENTPASAPMFAAARGVLARKLARLRLVSQHIDQRHGGSPLTGKGGVLKAAVFETQMLASVEATLRELGLTPTAAAKLGVDLTKGEGMREEMERMRKAAARANERGGTVEEPSA